MPSPQEIFQDLQGFHLNPKQALQLAHQVRHRIIRYNLRELTKSYYLYFIDVSHENGSLFNA